MATSSRSLNIIEFAVQELHFTPTPVQRVLLKMFYGLPLDNTRCDLQIKVSGWQNGGHALTEAEYAKYLFEQGRANYKEGNTGPFQELVLVAGRRGGKTQISALILNYEAYKLLGHECPQAYYGLSASNTIQLVSVSTNGDQARLLFQDVAYLAQKSKWIQGHFANSSKSFARFQTDHDIAKYGRYADDPTARATINLGFRSCLFKSACGAANLVVVMDEVAHFLNNGQTSPEMIYQALTPSLSVFTPKDSSGAPIGPNEGKTVMISSPLGKEGFFYESFITGRAQTAGGKKLCLQIPSWDLNPTIPLEYLQKEHDKDPLGFFTEYGAEFYPERIPYNVEGEALVNGELKTNVVFRALGEDGVVVQKNPRGGWIVTTGNVA